MPVEAPPAPPAAPPAPATPAPSPSARPVTTVQTPPVKAKVPAISGKPVSEPAKDFNDAISTLGKIADKESGLAPVEEPPKAPETKPDDQPPKPPDEKTAPPTAPPQDGKKEPVKAATLRENYDRVKAENTELQKRLKDFEEKAKTPAEDPEKKKLSETLAEREKRLAELEEDQRFTNYERSQEYLDKWYAPFASAYKAGQARVSSLKLTDENGNVRQGTAEDFDALMQITDSDMAADRAAELFGNKASMVMYHREKALELNAARVNALEDFRKNGAEREKQRADQWKQDSEKIVKQAGELWQKHKTAPHESHPLFFKPIEGDEAGNKLLEDGFKEADEAFRHMNALDPRLTADQRETVLKRHATVYNKAAAFNRLAHLFKNERAARKAAEEKLKAFEESEPGPGDGKGGGKPTLDTWGQVNADLMKYAGR